MGTTTDYILDEALILANRLKALLPQIILPNQTAVVKDRLLMENVLLAFELVKDYHKEGISPRCAMKIDISKAFDSVQWTFLLNTLQAMNFPPRFIHWIRLCISTATFSVQVNGELAGFFGSKRGLRQGCALSPYLFVICMNVLSHLINKAAADGRFGYHPRCHNLLLTHLCFADDLMVFAEGTKHSIEGVITIFDEFARCSGLKISLEKSTLYMAGIAQHTQEAIRLDFPFETGHLPVRYLGLPLMTKVMTSSDYLPLIEKIKSRISSWTRRFLSYAGRLQLIRSVLTSITNFWSSAFRLPGACMKEVEKLCSSFLWSGPTLKTHGAKVAWHDVCLPKEEGGLGLRPLKETNKVSGLKLIWRLLASKTSLWGQWVRDNLFRRQSFWEIKETSSQGSWMWRKLLKLRNTAKSFHMMEIKSGESTSFWYDRWCSVGRIFDALGDRGSIDLGISRQATVADVLEYHRQRRHRTVVLNNIESEISDTRSRRKHGEADIHLWKGKTGFQRKFTTRETWNLIRQERPTCNWAKGIWFPQATPKFSFITWLAMRDRLSTGNRMGLWNRNANISCVFCQEPVETRAHLFFQCPYTQQIWRKLTQGFLLQHYTSDWDQVKGLIYRTTLAGHTLMVLRYVLQTTIYSLWRERNARRHGEPPSPATLIEKLIDKTVRNRLSILRSSGNKKYEDLLIFWFSTRI